MYNIDLLSKITGISKRSIRYYIEIGLLDPPIGACRGSYYTEQHLKKLETIKLWTSYGMPVTQIKYLIEEDNNINSINNIDTLTKWSRYKVNEDIEINFKNNILDENDLLEINKFINKVLENRSKAKVNF